MFGTFLSAWVAVTSPVLVSMLGLDLLTTGFGTLTFVRGCAALLGTYGPSIHCYKFHNKHSFFSPQIFLF
jgi:hypothetical protein